MLGRYDIPGLYRKVADAYSRGKVTIALEAAVDMYRKAMEDNPKDIEVYYALDDLYEKAGDNKDRRDLLSRGRQLFPEDDALALRQARYFAWRTWYDQAAKILGTHKFHRTHQSRQLMGIAQRAIEDTYAGLAMRAMRSGDKAKAVEYLDEASKAAETLKKWFD
jgi:tetratricopeptide (TPR) repeat protein